MVQDKPALGPQQANRIDRIELSVVIPVYNAEHTIKELFAKLEKILQEMGFTWQIVMVDDHSADLSWCLIKDLCQHDSRVAGIRLAANFGQHAATLCGISASRGRYVITMDDDLDNDPAVIPMLWARRTILDVTFAAPSAHEQLWWKDSGSSLVHFLLRHCYKIHDVRFPFGSFRLLSPVVVGQLLNINTGGVYLNAEILKAASRSGYVIVENTKTKKPTRYTLTKSIKLAANLIWGYTSWPGWIAGLALILMAVAIPAYAATTAITHYFIIGLWIILTLILFSLSVVGFFYSRLSKQILYVIEERAGEGFI
jgi:undecaprenyl-phosphate 4-deoxy-4-formamido-L-arabinose transferase